MLRRICLTSGLFLFACLSSGCSPDGPEIADVEGKITMDGKPLANAAVMFIPENGRPAVARTDDEGRYVLNFTEGRVGAIPGKNRVSVTTLRDAGEKEDGTPVPGSPETVPLKYNAESKLEFDVKPGEKNVANFDLTTKK